MSDRKQCPQCGEELPLDSFAVDRRKKSGHKSICKPCDREKSRHYYSENRERKLAKMEAERRARGVKPRKTRR